MNWRTDIENAPKDKPIIVINPAWDGRGICRYTYQVVEWTKIDRYDEESTVYGWVFEFDHEYDYYRTVNNPKYWMEIPDRPKI